MKKVREKRNSFHGHFQCDFSKSCIFPIEEIYQKSNMPGKTVPFYFSEKLKNWNLLNFELKLLIEDTGYRL